MQRFSLEQNQTLRQEQILAPQQLQSLEILLAAIPELEQKIDAELLDNPTLERIDRGGQELVGNPVEQNEHHPLTPSAAPGEQMQGLENSVDLHDLWQDRLPAASPAGTFNQFSTEDEERRQFFFDSLVAEPSVQENLLQQLRELGTMDEQSQFVCEQIVGSIDDQGYLRTHLADLAIAAGIGDLHLVEKCLKIIQQFDPPGIGARDLRECLLLQLQRRNQQGSVAYRLVDKHLEDLGKNRHELIARSLRLSPGELRDALQLIRRLHPHPGTLIAPNDNTDFVAPEVFIERDDKNEWRVRTNRDTLPRLRLAPHYLKMLDDPTVTDEVKTYIRHKIVDGKGLIKALEQRESTLMRIARSLLKFQIGFFEQGIGAMRPLTMNQVAEEIQVHETTVSRAIANKYVMTPHGLHPFRHFFSSGFTSHTGEEFSSLAIKQKIKHLVDHETAGKPLSDQKLADLLRADGFDVARRTVAKYREEMGLQTSTARRQF